MRRRASLLEGTGNPGFNQPGSTGLRRERCELRVGFGTISCVDVLASRKKGSECYGFSGSSTSTLAGIASTRSMLSGKQ